MRATPPCTRSLCAGPSSPYAAAWHGMRAVWQALRGPGLAHSASSFMPRLSPPACKRSDCCCCARPPAPPRSPRPFAATHTPQIILSLLICIIDICESISIARALAQKNHYQLNPTQVGPGFSGLRGVLRLL